MVPPWDRFAPFGSWRLRAPFSRHWPAVESRKRNREGGACQLPGPAPPARFPFKLATLSYHDTGQHFGHLLQVTLTSVSEYLGASACERLSSIAPASATYCIRPSQSFPCFILPPAPTSLSFFFSLLLHFLPPPAHCLGVS